MNTPLRSCLAIMVSLLCGLAVAQDDTQQGAERWWRGSMHVHSWWSDGNWPPELVAKWYKEHGYQFLVLSDHNTLQHGERWFTVDKPPGSSVQAAYAEYLQAYGPEWVEQRETDGKRQVRLKTLDEIRALFEAPAEFIFIEGEEITSEVWTHAVHVNATNLVERIAPVRDRSVTATVQDNLDSIAAQGEQYDRPVLATLNHPNFQFAQTAEDLFAVDYAPGGLLLEIYDGFPDAQNYGDRYHESAERIWDILLARRLGSLGRDPILGVAVDDAHFDLDWGVGNSNPGRGWVMVRANSLQPNAITEAMRRGDFYNSTGVTLSTLDIGASHIELAVDARFGVNYRIEFIGTLQDADLEPYLYTDSPHTHLGSQNHLHKMVYRYSRDIGKVLKTVNGTHARYEAKGNEIYVRARITSSFVHPNGYAGGDTEMAWTQPLVVLKNGPPR